MTNLETNEEEYDFTDLSQFTPVMRQFLEVKNRYPETLVLFRLGDFYETFFNDAVKANRLIGITLTKRGKLPDGRPIPMAGIPAVSLDSYMARLVRLGESIVIVEQIGVPGKGTMDRKISRIVTPGTLTESTLLPEKSDSILLAAAAPKRGEKNYGLAWLTLSNGDFRAESVPADQFESVLARIAPSEVLVSEELKRTLRESHPHLPLTSLPDWHFDGERGEKLLCRTFGLANLDAWGVSGRRDVLAAANALLDYTSETQVDMIPFILPMKLEEEHHFLVLDPTTRRNLEIDESLSPNGSGPTLFSVLDRCGTAMGSRELRRWLREPLREPDAVLKRQAALAALIDERSLESALAEAIAPLPDVERIASRIALKTARPRDLAALRDALPQLERICGLLAPRREALLKEAAQALQLPDLLSKELNRMLLDEPALQLRDGDVIRSEASPELAELRRLRDDVGALLLEIETRERSATGLSTLRVEYNKVSGFFIEVSRLQSTRVPAHYQRRQTLKNTERYTTPELRALEDRILSAKERAALLERQLYDALLSALSPSVGDLIAAAHAAARLDAACSSARHAAQHGWCRPTLAARPGIRIDAARHPVVEEMIEYYVPNACRLEDGRRMLIITGPNMGGKSTYMRSVALIALLAWAGLFVPADAAEIGPVDRILTRIGASDDLSHGRSTFMVEMTEAAAILHQATDQSLVLMDEIGRGTSTYDGLSLAAAIAEALVSSTRSLTLFATHYFELTELSSRLREVANIHVSASQSRSGVVFRHQLEEGPASRSYGIAVAQLAGVPAPVVRRARQYLASLEARERARQAAEPDLFADLLHAPEPEPEFPPADDPEAEARTEALCAFAREVADKDLDSLTPREALAWAYDLASRAKKLI